jgi:VanZ like family
MMPSRLIPVFRSVIPAILWTVIIFILLAMPGSMLPKEKGFRIPNFDKIVHMTLFGGFVLLWAWRLDAKLPPVSKPTRWYFGLFMLSCAYGTAMEFVQKYFVVGRDYDTMDILADALGAFIAWLILYFSFLRKKQKIA